MDKIFISDLPVSCRIGVPEDERAVAQRILIDLELSLDLAEAGGFDDFTKTVDYDAVCSTAVATARAKPRKLIETLGEDIAAAVLSAHGVESVLIRVKKPEALRRRGAAYAAVEITRRRAGSNDG
ncbi:MAG: dihydroneopterin aldolase [Pirellulales bacterium]|nr:dihydroneopterin aldolase [Pirellulales bacterium]